MLDKQTRNFVILACIAVLIGFAVSRLERKQAYEIKATQGLSYIYIDCKGTDIDNGNVVLFECTDGTFASALAQFKYIRNNRRVTFFSQGKYTTTVTTEQR